MITFTLVMFWIFVGFVVLMIILLWAAENPESASSVFWWIVAVVIFSIALYNSRSDRTAERDEVIKQIMRGEPVQTSPAPAVPSEAPPVDDNKEYY
jgi:hypothetical protein